MQSDHNTHGCDYRWSRITPEYQDLIDTVKWQNVLAFASELHNGEVCNAEGPVGMGGRNFVRVLTFEGGERWLARFPLNQTDTDSLMLREADCLRIVAEQSNVPVPKVFAAVPQKPEFGKAFMLMECLPGNVGVDMDHDQIPQQHKSKFFKQMADAHARISNILFPRIGTPFRQNDGTTSVGPIPGIGGPFDTASAFFRAWSAAVTFPLSEKRVKEDCGLLGDEVWESISGFPKRVGELANLISGPYENGPFPLVHVDFGHNNIVVDSEYNILGVIDWENAISAPWGMVEYPLTVRATPVPMDASWNYKSDGSPTDDDLVEKHKDRQEYLQAVIDAERELGLSPGLSKALSNIQIRDVAAAMKLFGIDGKMGWYSRVLDTLEDAASC